jgi:hypothetical protein
MEKIIAYIILIFVCHVIAGVALRKYDQRRRRGQIAEQRRQIADMTGVDYHIYNISADEKCVVKENLIYD